MLTSLEKTPRLDAVCSNFLAQVLNISGDRNISVHQWDKCTAEGDWQANPGAILSGFDQQYFLVDLNNPWLWHVGSETAEPLSDWHAAQTLPQNTLPPASTKGNQASTGVFTAKTHDKSKKKLLSTADQTGWTWRTLIISFHLFLGPARNYQQKVCLLPPLGSALL